MSTTVPEASLRTADASPKAIGSLNVNVILAPTATDVDLSDGDDDKRVGAVLSEIVYADAKAEKLPQR